jgi:hypothetical protein
MNLDYLFEGRLLIVNFSLLAVIDSYWVLPRLHVYEVWRL